MLGCGDDKKQCGVNEATGQCGQCLQTNCGSQFTTCYGPGWRSGDLTGGLCAGYARCLQGCCSPSPSCQCNQVCATSCMAQSTQDCRMCIQTAITCESSSCLQACSAPPPDAAPPDAGPG